jgi:hypothetical protein
MSRMLLPNHPLLCILAATNHHNTFRPDLATGYSTLQFLALKRRPISALSCATRALSNVLVRRAVTEFFLFRAPAILIIPTDRRLL